MKKYAFIQRLFRAESELACFNEVRDARVADAGHERSALFRRLRFAGWARSLCGRQRLGLRRRAGTSQLFEFGRRRPRREHGSGGQLRARWRRRGRANGRLRERVRRCRHVPRRCLRDRLQPAGHVHQPGEVPGRRRVPGRVRRDVGVLERYRLHASVALRHPVHGHVELSERRALRRQSMHDRLRHRGLVQQPDQL